MKESPIKEVGTPSSVAKESETVVESSVVISTPPPPASAPADEQKGGKEWPPGHTGGTNVDELLKEAQMLMKSLRPSVKAIHMCKASVPGVKTGLLDGGATNALCQGTPDELKSALPVRVELAAGSAQLFQDMSSGTLLSPQEVEPIVPLRGLVNLGYQISWNASGFTIQHKKFGRIRSWLRNGCPVVKDTHDTRDRGIRTPTKAWSQDCLRATVFNYSTVVEREFPTCSHGGFGVHGWTGCFIRHVKTSMES